MVLEVAVKDAVEAERPLTDRAAEHRELLALARRTLEQYLASGQRVAWETDNPWYLAPAAVFVTLRLRPDLPGEGGDLRGCIGQVEADLPLYLAIQDAAIKAATVDPRFYPVRPDELEFLIIEISVLSPMEPVDRPEDIQLGRDGLYIVGQHRRGLLLPEVPGMYGWTVKEFVRHVCRKAGLPDDAWPGPARLYRFTTESFEE